MFTPTTTTRSSFGNTACTSPRSPRSLPAITSTVSPFLIFCIVATLSELQGFRRERHDLQVAPVTQFACYRPEDARSTRVLQVVVQNNSGVIVKTDVRAIIAAVFFRNAHDHSLHYIALFDAAVRCRGFHRPHHNVANVRVAAERAAQHADHEQFLRARIIRDLDARFVLDHRYASPSSSLSSTASSSAAPSSMLASSSVSAASASPTSSNSPSTIPSSASRVTSVSPGFARTASTTQRFVLLRGLLSTIRTSDPTFTSLFSSCACTFLVDTTIFL